MKTPKDAQETSAQEECGVWLDTVQLKGKAKQKRLVRPISKLLNPFTKGGGYSLAVALNFTQTKLEMPKTKQSAISTFFMSHRRVLNKMSTSEVPDIKSSTSTTAGTAASGRKRRRDICLEKSDLYNLESSLAHEWESMGENEAPATLSQKQEVAHSPAQNMYKSDKDTSEECKPPQSKRRPTDISWFPGDSQPVPQAWSQDPLFTCSQYSESGFYMTNQKDTTVDNFEPSILNSIQNTEVFADLIDMKGRTSTQKSFKQLHSSQVDDEKENRGLLYNSPRKHSSSHVGDLSNHKWTEPKTASPRKCINHLWNKSGKEESLDLQFEWTKPCSSPPKTKVPQQQSREVDEDRLATLFTQDSEGFRVIAHRGLQTRSPLKDQSNMITGLMRSSAHTSLVEEEEDELLFTEDSQGNVVIKH
ncbi:aurora kinase A and ninein-interacting protein [Parambassis ranga]|uniref:Aurora kinase A and ninein-interacting protein n=1 Tax=Parambassis ranga TaxID=210632 RepID=A0A6P7JW08_9TELE|nr:aurora kinase A and ninein-interacting protein [Parambassis ranga]